MRFSCIILLCQWRGTTSNNSNMLLLDIVIEERIEGRWRLFSIVDALADCNWIGFIHSFNWRATITIWPDLSSCKLQPDSTETSKCNTEPVAICTLLTGPGPTSSLLHSKLHQTLSITHYSPILVYNSSFNKHPIGTANLSKSLDTL